MLQVDANGAPGCPDELLFGNTGRHGQANRARTGCGVLIRVYAGFCLYAEFIGNGRGLFVARVSLTGNKGKGGGVRVDGTGRHAHACKAAYTYAEAFSFHRDLVFSVHGKRIEAAFLYNVA